MNNSKGENNCDSEGNKDTTKLNFHYSNNIDAIYQVIVAIVFFSHMTLLRENEREKERVDCCWYKLKCMYVAKVHQYFAGFVCNTQNIRPIRMEKLTLRREILDRNNKQLPRSTRKSSSMRHSNSRNTKQTN